ncbi:MAG: hypothetical protein IJA83_11710 [Clostridia bacterium]|nr:hypothetical protein [Clostridia bacterium]
MTIKVSDVMRHVRNHFVADCITGSFVHTGGTLTPGDAFQPGMWIAVCGKDAPQGVYQLDENGGIPDLGDRDFRASIYRLNPPADFIRLCGDIACWAAANPDPAVSAEKLGEYSVSRRAVTWESAFAPALAPYRRMFAEVTA